MWVARGAAGGSWCRSWWCGPPGQAYPSSAARCPPTGVRWPFTPLCCSSPPSAGWPSSPSWAVSRRWSLRSCWLQRPTAPLPLARPSHHAGAGASLSAPVVTCDSLRQAYFRAWQQTLASVLSCRPIQISGRGWQCGVRSLCNIAHFRSLPCISLSGNWAAAMASAVQFRPAAMAAARPARALSSSSVVIRGSAILRSPLRLPSRPAARQVTTMGLFGLGVPELAVIAGVAAVIFGALDADVRLGA